LETTQYTVSSQAYLAAFSLLTASISLLAAQELAGYGLGAIIITLMATTTALFQLFAPLGIQYAIKSAGEVTA